MFKIVIIIAFLTICENLHAYSNQACSVFQYASYNGVNIGKVDLNNDRSGSYRLNVNMSAASYLDQIGNIKLELRTSVNDIIKGNPLVYYIYFPSQTHLPKPTRIEFNGRVYCTGSTEQVKPGVGITNFWATDFISTSVSVSHYKPAEYNPYYPVVVENKPKPNTEVVDSSYPPIIDILHPETSLNENNSVNAIANPIQNPIFNPIEYTTAKNSDDFQTTLKTVNVVNNSTVDCVNTTTVDQPKLDSNNQNSWSSKGSSYSYKCKEVHTINQSTHTVSVSKD